MIHTNLFEKILIDPAIEGCNKLLIASGFGSATMASVHIEKLIKLRPEVRIQLILGMPIKEGILRQTHEGFNRLSSENYITKFECLYLKTMPQLHSKLYIWLNDDTPKIAFTGSANYTQLAFSNKQRELMTTCDFKKSIKYYHSLYLQSIDCRDSIIESIFNIYEEKFYNSFLKKVSHISGTDFSKEIEEIKSLESIRISFLDNKGNLPEHSGLNWAFRRKFTRHDRNQSYIRVPSKIARSDFFPEKAKHFTVLTDDKKNMICSIAQQGRKAIHTPINNGFMGEFLRNRLSLPNGSFIRKEDLQRYGRTDIDFYKIDDETYFMDFSVQH